MKAAAALPIRTLRHDTIAVSSWAGRSPGFTLLEILMAISIFAIVISLAYGSYRATFRIIDNTESQAEIYSKARVAMERISNDLASLYPGPTGLLQGAPIHSGNTDTGLIHLTSMAHLVLNKTELPAGYATITYRTEQDRETDTLRLFRCDKPFRPAETQKPDPDKGLLLVDGLQDIQIFYHSKDKDQQDTWDSKELRKGDTSARNFPDRIEINLLFANPTPDGKPLRFSTAVTFPSLPSVKEH